MSFHVLCFLHTRDARDTTPTLPPAQEWCGNGDLNGTGKAERVVVVGDLPYVQCLESTLKEVRQWAVGTSTEWGRHSWVYNAPTRSTPEPSGVQYWQAGRQAGRQTWPARRRGRRVGEGPAPAPAVVGAGRGAARGRRVGGQRPRQARGGRDRRLGGRGGGHSRRTGVYRGTPLQALLLRRRRGRWRAAAGPPPALVPPTLPLTL